MQAELPLPDKTGLRNFGIITGLLIIILIGTLVPWIWDQDILAWQRYTGSIGGVLIVWGLVHPQSLILIYKPWMALAEKLGWLNTRIIMFLMFYILFLPMGIMMRLVGKDPMNRKFDPEAESYRIKREPQDKDHMETPY